MDYLLDRNANTIGALMLHLAATETYYQLNTFEGKKWGDWPDSVKKEWAPPAMNLGDVITPTPARQRLLAARMRPHPLRYAANARSGRVSV